MPKITTLLPTFQRPKLLARAIESVLNQTYSDFILYIFDNASEDETGDIVRHYQAQDSRIKYSCHQDNVGIIQNFIQATQKIETQFFSFLSDDDYLLPCFYENALKGFQDYPEAGFSICKTVTTNSKGKFHPRQFLFPNLSGYFTAPNGLLALLKLSAFPLWTGILFKHEVLQKLGGLDSRAGANLDLDFTLKCAITFPFVISPQPSAVFVIWGKGHSLQSHIDRSNFSMIHKNMTDSLREEKKILEEVLNYLSAHEKAVNLNRWMTFLLDGNITKAKKAKISFLEQGGSVNKWLFKLLNLSESSVICRYFFQFLVWARRQIYFFRAFRHLLYIRKYQREMNPNIRP